MESLYKEERSDSRVATHESLSWMHIHDPFGQEIALDIIIHQNGMTWTF
jgi:hypothetical protein